MMTHYLVGLDVSLRSCALCIVDAKGKVVFERELLCDVDDIAHCLVQLPHSITRIGNYDCCATSQSASVSQRGSPLPIRHMRAAMHTMHQQDCEEKRDPDEYKNPIYNKEKELDQNAQLEKPTFGRASSCLSSITEAAIQFWNESRP